MKARQDNSLNQICIVNGFTNSTSRRKHDVYLAPTDPWCTSKAWIMETKLELSGILPFCGRDRQLQTNVYLELPRYKLEYEQQEGLLSRMSYKVP